MVQVTKRSINGTYVSVERFQHTGHAREYIQGMKSDPSEMQEESSMDRLDRAFRAVLAVPKEAVVKAEAKAKQKRDKKRAKKRS